MITRRMVIVGSLLTSSIIGSFPSPRSPQAQPRDAAA